MKPTIAYTGNGAETRTVFHDIYAANHHIAQLETLVAQQAAVIERMREYFELIKNRFCGWHTVAEEALALQPCPEVLNKVRANAVELAAHEAWMSASSDCEDRVKAAVLLLAQRIEKGEAMDSGYNISDAYVERNLRAELKRFADENARLREELAAAQAAVKKYADLLRICRLSNLSQELDVAIDKAIEQEQCK